MYGFTAHMPDYLLKVMWARSRPSTTLQVARLFPLSVTKQAVEYAYYCIEIQYISGELRNSNSGNCFPPAPQRFALSLACPFAHQSPSKYFSYLAALIYTSHGSKQRRVPGTLIETPEISFETMDGFLVWYCFFIFISFYLFIYLLTTPTTMEYFSFGKWYYPRDYGLTVAISTGFHHSDDLQIFGNQFRLSRSTP